MSQPVEALFSRTERVLFGLGALALVALAATAALRWEIDDNRRTFDLESNSIALQVSRRLAAGETLIAALHAIHDGSNEVTDARFPSIVERFVEGHPQVRWIATAEQVARGAEVDFERRLHRQGFMGLRIHPFPDAVEVPADDLRLPIYHLEPLTPLRARLLGADVTSREEWREALADAVDTGTIRAVATRAPSLGLDGVLLLRATYRGNVEPDSKVERRQQLAGMLMLFLDAGKLVADLVTALPGVQASMITQGLASWRAPPPGTDSWSSHQSIVLPKTVANIQLPLEVRAELKPALRGVIASALIAVLIVLSLWHGLRQRRMAQREERHAFVQARLAEITLHSIGDAVIRLDDDGKVRYMNPVAEIMSGMSDDDVRGQALEDVLDLSARGQVTTHSLAHLTDGRADVLVNCPRGLKRTVACTVSPITDTAGAIEGRVLVLRDVSREHELSRELAFQASHDPLTELPNRREFERQLTRAVAQSRSSGATHCLLYIDLDQFKLVNDTCGHAAGDRMLRQIAGLLAAEVRDGDLLARLGGDEFGVLLKGCTVDIAMPIAERICAVVSGFRFIADGRAFELGASIGLVEIGRNSGTADEVQRTADLACYAAKDSGRNRVHLYRHEDRIISRNHGEMQWHSKIKNALKDDRLVLYAQAIKRLRRQDGHSDDRCHGPAHMHELLLRMVNAEGALVPPMAFLPAAERYGLMDAIDRTVIEKAFTHVARADMAEHVFSINLSGPSFSDPEIGDFIVAAAARIGVDPRQVCFEVTETAAISNLAQAEHLMQRLHAEGFRFALDDFGAGLSSFAYLKQLPVDFIKIDGQFVRDISTDAVARAMVMSIVNVARVLGIATIAEKVEGEATQHCLQTLGVDYVQGFYVGRPTPIADSVVAFARSA